MTCKVIKFPESYECKLDRIIATHDFLIADCEHKVRRANWFFSGFLFGLISMLAIVSGVYYFVGAP